MGREQCIEELGLACSCFGASGLHVSNAGTRVVTATAQAEAGLYTSATLDEPSHELIVKAINCRIR